MKKLQLTLLLIHFLKCGFSQNICPHKPKATVLEFHEKFNSGNYSSRGTNEIIYLPVRVHNLVKDNGIIGRVSKDKIEDAFTIANNRFINLNIQFYQCGDVHYIKNTLVYEDKFLFENVLDEKVNNMFNLFIVDKMSMVVEDANLEYDIAGVGGGGCVIIEKKFINDEKVLIHEIGHALSLLHTFGSGVGEKLTDELVDGSNCHTAGDFICDTPADHYLFAKENSCSSIDGRMDANGQLFDPPDNNVMSYKTCDKNLQFTPDQMLRMYYYALTQFATFECPDKIAYFDPKLFLYPNPTATSFTLNFNAPRETHATIYLYNTLGEKTTILHQTSTTKGFQEVTVSIPQEISSGFYFIGVHFIDNIYFKKIIIVQ